MVSFSYNIKNIKSIVKQVTWLLTKQVIIIGIICFVLMLYCLPIGLTYNNKDLTYMGFASFVVVVFAIYCWLRTYSSYKKYLHNSFNKAQTDVLEFYLEKKENVYIFGCDKLGEKKEFSVYDIAKICYSKKAIIIKLKSKKFIDMANTSEIRNLLSR